MIHLEFEWNLLLLVAAGFMAGVINTIAGGGSLITLPLLIFLGLPPSIANGTNRIAIFAQNIFTTAGFKSRGVSTFPFNVYLGLSALVGAIIGAAIAVDIRGDIFNKILAFIMVLVVIFIVFKPKKSLTEYTERLTGKYLWIGIVVFFFIGIYGGFIQAGVGFFMILALSGIHRMSLVRTNATKVMVALIFTVGAIVTFAYHGKINWGYGLVLAIGNASGGWFASRWSVSKGDGLVKIFLVIMVIAMAIKLWFF